MTENWQEENDRDRDRDRDRKDNHWGACVLIKLSAHPEQVDFVRMFLIIIPDVLYIYQCRNTEEREREKK